MSLFTSILLALMNRDKTGKGTTVTTSLLANGIWSNAMLIQAILAGHNPIETFYWNDLSALRNIYTLKDNTKLFILVTNEDKHWPTLLTELELQNLLIDKKFNTEDLRQKNKKLFKKELQTAFSKYKYEDIKEKLVKQGIVFTKIMSTEETITDPQTISNEYVYAELKVN